MQTLFKFQNVRELLRTFDTEEKCIKYLVETRWGNKPQCPHCKNEEKIWEYKNGKLYKCSCCKKQFTVLTDTIFQGTRIQLKDWFYAMYIFVNHKKGISSIQMSKDLGITQKSAWLMLHKI